MLMANEPQPYYNYYYLNYFYIFYKHILHLIKSSLILVFTLNHSYYTQSLHLEHKNIECPTQNSIEVFLSKNFFIVLPLV
jgi:hypothetical protein